MSFTFNFILFFLIFNLILSNIQAGPISGMACANCLAINCSKAAYMCYPTFPQPPTFIMCVFANASWGAYFSCIPVCGSAFLPIP